MHDVVVIGAGPAGSITAAQLAARGRDVVVLEEHAQPGLPVHCTGLLGIEAFDDFDLPHRLVLGATDEAWFGGVTGDLIHVRSDRTQAAVIDRVALDVLLAGRAAVAGADLRLGCRAEAITVEPSRVRVRTREADPVDARSCVIACGANYRFHRDLGLGLPDLFLQSAQLDTAFPAFGGVEVRFGREMAPGGFAWVVPYTQAGTARARIGLMGETRSRERFAAFVARLCDRAGVNPASLAPPRLKALPLGPIARTFAHRVLAVGDAAGLVKPTTGGGIYYGLLSGTMAAEVLDEALGRDRLGEGQLKRYEGAWRRRLGQEIRVGLAFRRIASRLTDESIESLIELARVNGVVPILQQTASFNWHRRAALALLGHPAFRRIALKSWATSGPI